MVTTSLSIAEISLVMTLLIPSWGSLILLIFLDASIGLILS